ncbi:MAG: hypothetical protein HZB76_00705 [Chlamydiae bacterium]|nr:hypothetical protein [Chlamydiota bacterium]
MKPKNVLIITSSGGNGLIQAAKAKEQEIKEQNPKSKVITQDLMLHWAIKPIGPLGVMCWNKFQKIGSIFLQNFIVKWQWIADYLFWPHVYFHTKSILFKENIDLVIDTQPVATSAILSAVRYYNKIAKKDVVVEKTIVDLPTTKCVHFFNNIKKLSKENRKILRIVTLDPLLKPNETEEEFWQKNAAMPLENVRYEKYFIRTAFKKYQHKKRNQKTFNIKIKNQDKKERKIIQSIVKKGVIKASFLKNYIDLTINNSNIVITLLLGSQPPFNATLSYVKQTIDHLKKHPIKRPVHFFVFCAKKESRLLDEISKMVFQTKNYPANLSIIPMSFQKDDVIAPLFFRSNLTITKSGGGTIVELLAVGQGKHCIHSEAYSKNGLPSLEKLLKGISFWEGGNALYLKHNKGAEVINTQSYPSICKEFFHSIK